MGFLNSAIFMFFVASFSCSQLVYGNSEVKALMQLKASLDPENRVLKSWTIDGDHCSGAFDGVACNEHRKVANISLQGRGLSGTVSPAVAELKCLSGLFLHYNNLSGEIPREISSLTELADLYLDVNSFTGNIPEEIGNMSNLQGLFCSLFIWNQLRRRQPWKDSIFVCLFVLCSFTDLLQQIEWKNPAKDWIIEEANSSCFTTQQIKRRNP